MSQARSQDKRNEHPNFKCALCSFKCLRATLYQDHLDSNDLCKKFSELMTIDLTKGSTSRAGRVPAPGRKANPTIDEEFFKWVLDKDYSRNIPIPNYGKKQPTHFMSLIFISLSTMKATSFICLLSHSFPYTLIFLYSHDVIALHLGKPFCLHHIIFMGNPHSFLQIISCHYQLDKSGGSQQAKIIAAAGISQGHILWWIFVSPHKTTAKCLPSQKE